jgi:hypothetical protein
VDTVAELTEILELCEDDEKFAVQQALTLVKKIRAAPPVGYDREHMGYFKEVYETNVRLGIPREEWHPAIIAYEAYEARGNVNGSGACAAGATPIPLGEPEYVMGVTWDGNKAKVEPVVEHEVIGG